MNNNHNTPCLDASVPDSASVRTARHWLPALLLTLTCPAFAVAGETPPLALDELPPQAAAQAAATSLPAWRPLDGLFNLFGATAPDGLEIRRSLADMHYPGPDLTNYPNSAFTLPRGGIYVEANPGAFTGGSDISRASWAMPYLLRYGLTNDIELRVLSDGLTVESDTVGFAPVGFDTKMHLGVVEYGAFNATIGLEATVQTGKWLASKAFEDGDQYTLNLLIDHFLPGDLSFEWNIGVTRFTSQNQDLFLPTVQWAFQRDIAEDVAVYINGYHSAIPTVDITGSGFGTARWPQEQLIGVGAQWIFSERVAFFTGCNWGFTRFSPDYSTNLGFAISL